jgi:hypothetical protein
LFIRQKSFGAFVGRRGGGRKGPSLLEPEPPPSYFGMPRRGRFSPQPKEPPPAERSMAPQPSTEWFLEHTNDPVWQFCLWDHQAHYQLRSEDENVVLTAFQAYHELLPHTDRFNALRNRLINTHWSPGQPITIRFPTVAPPTQPAPLPAPQRPVSSAPASSNPFAPLATPLSGSVSPPAWDEEIRSDLSEVEFHDMNTMDDSVHTNDNTVHHRAHGILALLEGESLDSLVAADLASLQVLASRLNVILGLTGPKPAAVQSVELLTKTLPGPAQTPRVTSPAPPCPPRSPDRPPPPRCTQAQLLQRKPPPLPKQSYAKAAATVPPSAPSKTAALRKSCLRQGTKATKVVLRFPEQEHMPAVSQLWGSIAGCRNYTMSNHNSIISMLA